MDRPPLTLADVLKLPMLLDAGATVLSGAKFLDTTVRGVLVSKVNPSTRPIRQGDILLVTGHELPASSAEMSTFIQQFSAAGAAGLIIERTSAAIPFSDAVLAEFNRIHLPVIATTRPLSFEAVLQMITDMLIDNHMAELVSARRIHTAFNELTFSDATIEDVLLTAQRLSGTDIAIENSAYQLMDYFCATEDDLRFTRNWEARSRSIPTQGRPLWNQANGWFVVPIGSASKGLGRLVLASPEEPNSTLTTIAERAATTLATLMQGKDTEANFLHRQHHNVLVELLSNPAGLDVCRRAWRAGMPSHNQKYVGVLIRPVGNATKTGISDSLHAIVTTCQRIATDTCLKCIVAAFDSDVRMLLGLPPTVDEITVIDDFANQLYENHSVIIAVGSSVTTFHTIDRTLRESLHVMSAMARSASPHHVCRLTSLHVRGLLTLLAMDGRVIDFTERELAPLIAASKTLHYDVLATVRILIENWESKSQAAGKLFISRPVLYERIRKIESIIGASIEDVEVRTSLHLALLSNELRGD